MDGFAVTLAGQPDFNDYIIGGERVGKQAILYTAKQRAFLETPVYEWIGFRDWMAIIGICN